MAWAESIFHTVRCLKRATRVEVVLVMLHVKSDESPETIVAVTVVAIEAHVAEVATAVVVAAEIAVDAVVTEADAAETAVVIEAHVQSDVILTMIAEDQVQIVQSRHHDQNDPTVMVKVAQIVVQGVLPVDTMVATVDQVHHADAKLLN